MINTWEDLAYWNTGEWQVVEERLSDLDVVGLKYCPKREDLFKALYETPLEKCKVMMVGQDPYPSLEHAMGLAFSVPKKVKVLPPTLQNIFEEYVSDLHYEPPMNGDLHDWANAGVLLWNSIPSCLAGRSMSHAWYEWGLLTEEIIKTLVERGTVFVFVGSYARLRSNMIKGSHNRLIEVAHPSPRASLRAKVPFKGSRIFTRTNDALSEIGYDPIDWRLQCQPKVKKQ